MSKKYSGKQVIKAGEKLVSQDISKEEFEFAMDVLSYWRLGHEAPLSDALKSIEEIALKVDKTAYCAKRLKRYVSIVNKLRRFREMKLKNMQDVGGCRVVVSSPKKLQQIVRTLKKRPEFKTSEGRTRHKDYISTPKPDGYRGYHLIGQFKDTHGESKSIEVQIRTNLQHGWATAVEIVDLFTGQKIKSNQGDDDWTDFFRCVSQQFAVMEYIPLFSFENRDTHRKYLEQIKEEDYLKSSCIAVQKYAKRMNVVEKFQAFSQSLRIIDGRIEEASVSGFVLIEVDTVKHTVKTTLFEERDSATAEQMYVEAEKRVAGKKGIVVALVSTTAVGGIKEAYPNYFADSTEFLKHLLIVTTAPIQGKRKFFSDLFS